MTKDTNKITKRIAQLNDTFRALTMKPDSEQTLGKTFYTASISALPPQDVLSIKEKVRLFDEFNESNDPYGEHDFGSFMHNDQKVYWKIDYEDPALEYQSNDTFDNGVQNRRLTIMLSHEW